jgi:galactose mutarotase-like enzyme
MYRAADMFEVRDIDEPLETVVLADAGADSYVTLAPARGGMLTRWVLRGRDVFYLDEGTLRDPTKNVRGGNPVLFPSPGKLVGNQYQCKGKRGTLEQHGFARTLPWSVVERGTEAAASVVLRLEANAQTRAVFDWDFTLDYRYALCGPRLRIEQQVVNTGTEAMPFGVGFHPYFRVEQADKANTRIDTTATRAFDAVQQSTVWPQIDLAVPELDLRLVDHGSKPCALHSPKLTITLTGCPEFSHWVLWTVQGKDFVCVEPWTCPADALNSGQGLLEVAPGATATLWLEMAVA